MRKCSMDGCGRDAKGGYMVQLPVTNFQSTADETADEEFYWCAEHEAEIRNEVTESPGRYLSLDS